MSNKLRIAIGTESEQKIGYLKEVLTEIGLDAEFIPNKVPSGVSDQPLTDDETKRGSINRARAALALHADVDIAIGIEVGYHKNEIDLYEIFCYATVIDKKDVIISSKSSSFPIPTFFQEKIKKDLPVGKYVHEYLEKDGDKTFKFIAEMLRGRKPFIKESVRNALLLYLNRTEFD